MTSKMRLGLCVRLAALLLGALSSAGTAKASFVTFESGQVRPLALTPDGRTLLALNTPDARLEIFAVDGGALSYRASVAVGLEPVAVAARSDTEVWVANLLSDSVSIVDLGAAPPRVVRTLLVGDEPRDIVFAGPGGTTGRRRAFITTARLGQNLPLPLELTTPGTPRALVWVFDAENLGTALGGTPLTILELFGDTPRALAASADGSTVYAAVFQSGNQTTIVTDSAVCDGGAGAPPCDIDGVQSPGGLPDGRAPGGVPPPNLNKENLPAPEVGIIVKLDRGDGVWKDELGRNWNNAVRFNLPDVDVFAIDALADPPRQTRSFAHVGTVLFNMIVDPSSGRVYVSNTEARNEVRFEGHGHSSTTLRGHLHESRISILDDGGVRSRHLNKHITALPQAYKTSPMPAAIKEASVATPVDMVLASTGKLYVAAFGSSKVAVYDIDELESDDFVPDASRMIPVSGGGPAGLALDEAAGRLFVLTRFDNAVKVVDTATRTEIAQHPLHNPEPEDVVAGRPFLYDALETSSNGEASCAVCHVFGDLDSLAWDLGDPDEVEKPNPNPLGPTGAQVPFHPMKGPMTTQTLRGMKHQGPMHWRGDRTGGEFVNDPRALDADLAFKAFNAAFDPLNGRDEGEISDEDMQLFTDFVLQVQAPPNPVRSLDNQLDETQAAARRLFRDRRRETDIAAECAGCHTLNAEEGHFGTLGQSTFTDEPQQFKVPQLKNLYQKIGMFGTPRTEFVHALPEHAQHQGDQIRGFGFLHDGSIATVFDFLRTETFIMTDDERRGMEQFIFAFDTAFAPIVGQQITLTSTNAATVTARIDLMIARARTAFVLVGQPGARECDLVARAVVDGKARGFLLDPVSATFQSDRAAETGLTDAQIRALASAAGREVTYTCAPPSEGTRLGLDRDGDGVFDQDELDSGTNPIDPDDFPTPAGFFTPTRTPTQTRTPTDTVEPTPTATTRVSRTPTPTRTPAIPGDADCNRVVDARDQAATCTAVFDEAAHVACPADCNGDGRVSAADALCVAQEASRSGSPVAVPEV